MPLFQPRHLLVTGGAGFIGSHFVDYALTQGARVTVLDAMTYAANRENLSDALTGQAGCVLIEGDIRDRQDVDRALGGGKFDAIVHFAAESHVDRSISGPSAFVTTNVVGTYVLLEAALDHWKKSWNADPSTFRFIQISTDEVYGSLGETGKFSETSNLSPNSPYSASKAASDHFARAWHHTFGLPAIVTHCTNNYGPRQHSEKLIPRIIQCALDGKPLPVFGNGRNVRDWIHVFDHVRGVWAALTRGQPGEVYDFGGNSELQNIEVVHRVCQTLDELRPRQDGRSYREQIEFVTDRAGHDWRYAIDDAKAVRELGYQREFSGFDRGLPEVVRWYVERHRKDRGGKA